MSEYDPEAFGARCDECILKKLRVGGPVGPDLRAGGASAIVVTESPREADVEYGRPLVDSSGIEFNESLKSVGIPRAALSITTAVACRPPENDMGLVAVKLSRHNKKAAAAGEQVLPSPIDCCRPRLLHDIGTMPNIVTLGKGALTAVTGISASITEVRGGPIEGDFIATGHFHEKAGGRVNVLPTIHPAFVLRARRWTRAFRSDLSRAFRWFQQGRLGWVEPYVNLKPSVEEVEAFLSRSDIAYVYDVETTIDDPLDAKLKCIGFAHENASIVVTFKSIEGPGGTLVDPPWYTSQELDLLRGIVRDFFIDETKIKVGHNAGYFDRVVIEQHFGVTPTPLLDTILMHRSVESELPHKLGYIGSVYTDVTTWKAAHTATNAQTDEELSHYCVFHGTMVQLADGTSMPIHEIVEKRLPVVVQSRDAETGTIVQKRVTGWFRNTVPEQTWKRIRLATTPPKARGLITTPEHEVHTLRGRVQAQDIRVGDPVFIDERSLSGEQFCAILGTLMGDSILVVSPSQRKNRFAAPRAALQGGHTTGSGFAQYKSHRLPGVIQLLPEQPQRPMSANGREGVSKPFTPFRSSMLHQLANIQQFVMDEDGTRRLHVPTLFVAGPIGLAWWFMDDGCLQKADGRFFKSDAIAISTQRYPLADVEAARDWLEKRFGRIYLGQDKVLRFTPEAAHAFGEYIAPHLPPVARYKLPRDRVFPDYDPAAWESSNDFATAKVVSVEDYEPPRETKHQRIRADTRYCLEVEDTHNFMTADGLVQNCAIDCVVTARVMPKLADAVNLRKQEEIVAYDHRIQSVCAGMHRVGMFVDRPLVAVKSDELKKTVVEHLASVREHAGRPNMNPNSTAQVRDLLFEEWQLTPTELTGMGDPSTSDEAIRLLRTQNRDREQVVKFIDALRRFRKYSKEYGTYVRKLVPFDEPLDGFVFANDEDGGEDEIDREASIEEQRRQTAMLPKKKRGLILFDHRIHPDYNAHGTTSGRLSSSNPNAQNFPKHLRALIMAQPGFVLVGADADQLELRIIASIAQIPRYLETLAKGGDPHADTASMMFGKAFDDLAPKSDQWSKLRGISKGIAYASFYGSGDETVHGLVTSAEKPDGTLMYPDLTLAQVTALRRRWLKHIPQLQKWWDDCLDTYRTLGYMTDPVWGRRRDFLDGEKFNEIINFGVQSGGAHIIHESTFPLVDAIPFERWGPGTGLINQCHDALVFEVPMEHGEHRPTDAEGNVKEKEREFGWCEIGCKCTANQVARMIKGAMNRSVPGLPDVTFAAKPKIGLRWSEV